jgi:hypothetical protein
MFEVMVRTYDRISCILDREPVSKLLGFTHRKSVDPHHCPSRVVCPVPRPRVQLPGGIKTRLECGDDQIIWRVDIDSVIEPPNRASESDGRVECLWVCDISEDPRYTSHVIGVRSANDGKILWLHPLFRLLNLYVLERDRRW